MSDQPRKSLASEPVSNPPIPDIQSLCSATEYTGLVPSAVPFDERENELRPFEGDHAPLSYEPYAGPDSKKN
ncbi:MAG: hypothetical protein E7331_12275 [Clostridiales bacterium]|nr:hypothetical protein [Clostridiales bacterium]